MPIPDDVKVVRYERLRSSSSSSVYHFVVIDRGGILHAFQMETGSGFGYNHLGSGSNAAALMELGVENVLNNVGGYDFNFSVDTKHLDAEGERAVGVLFHPLFGANWEKLTPREDVEDVVQEGFHKLLQRQVKDWKGSSSRFMVAGHRYWPTFLGMVHDAVRKEYGPRIKLYRGVYGDYAKEILQGEPIKIRRLTAWTLDPDMAKKFAFFGGGGGGGGYRKDFWLVISATYPVENILAAPVTLPDYAPDPTIYHAFKHEAEVVVEDSRGELPPGSYRILQKSRKKLADRVVERYLRRLNLP